MGIEYFLTAIYLLICFWRFPKTTFVRQSNLSSLELRLLLGFKIVSAIIAAFYLQRSGNNPDYQYYNSEGLAQYHLLLKNPALFFFDFKNDIDTYGFGGLFASEYSFWAYLRFTLLFKFLAILNLLTHGNFYLNTMVFGTLVFWGHIAFYRLYQDIYPAAKFKIIFGCFALPSLLLYTACVHKDGIIFLCIGIASYVFFRMIQAKRFISPKYTTLMTICLIIIFMFRNFVLVALLPAMLLALLCQWLPYKKRVVIFVIYILYAGAFFLPGFVRPALNLPATVVQRKADFAALTGGQTNIPMNDLQPDFPSFVGNLPQALNHYFFRPYIWEFSQAGVILTALELLFYQLLIVLFIFYRKKSGTPVHIFNIFGWAFLFHMALIIGYTIPNVGAIVRYRSIFWPLLLVPVLSNIDWKHIAGMFNSGKKLA